MCRLSDSIVLGRSSIRSAQSWSGTLVTGPRARVFGGRDTTSARLKALSPQPTVLAAAGDTASPRARIAMNLIMRREYRRVGSASRDDGRQG